MTEQEVLNQNNLNQQVSDNELTNRQILRRIDHTQLKPYATWSDIDRLCDEAVRYRTASVCIPPVYVKQVHDAYGDKVNICTVVAFRLATARRPRRWRRWSRRLPTAAMRLTWW